MTEESEHKMEFPSWVRLESGKNLFQYLIPYVELFLYYLINGKRAGLTLVPSHKI